MGENKFIKEIHKTLKKFVLNEHVDRNFISDAIKNRRVIQIFYKGDETVKAGYRTIEPYLLGITSGTTGGNNLAVRAWQQAGDSDSASGILSNRWRARKKDFDRDNIPGWRLFRLDGIKQAIPLSNRFAQNNNFRDKYNPNDKGMKSIIVRVNLSDTAPYDEFGVDSIGDTNVTVTTGGPDLASQEDAWKKFYQEPQNETEKIKERIKQFANIITRKRKEAYKNYVLMKDREMNDYKIVSQKAAKNNRQGKYPPEDIIGNMEQLYREHVLGNQPIDTGFFTKGLNQVKQASDKKTKENT